MAVGQHASLAHTGTGWLTPVVFPLADAEQSSSPRTGIGSDQEDSKPITLGEKDRQGSGKGSRDTQARPQVPEAEAPSTGSHGPHASSSCQLLRCPQAQPLPVTCDELGLASALFHGQHSPTGAMSLGDSSCHGVPWWGCSPQPCCHCQRQGS